MKRTSSNSTSHSRSHSHSRRSLPPHSLAYSSQAVGDGIVELNSLDLLDRQMGLTTISPPLNPISRNSSNNSNSSTNSPIASGSPLLSSPNPSPSTPDVPHHSNNNNNNNNNLNISSIETDSPPSVSTTFFICE